MHTLPRRFLDVKIDGRETFFEWLSAGHYTCQNERGTMAMVTQGPIKELYFGFHPETLLIRVDFEGRPEDALAGYEVLRIGFTEPPDKEIRIIQPGRVGQLCELFSQGSVVPASQVAVAMDRIVEIAIPLQTLGVKVDQPIHFFVEILESQQSRDRAPREGLIQLACPSPDFEKIMWDV